MVASDSGTYVYDSSDLNNPSIRLGNNSTNRLAFDSSGALLAVGSNLIPVVTAWLHTNGWTPIQEFTTRAAGHHIAFSPDGSYLASGTARDDLYFWETETGVQVGFIDFVGSDLRSIVFHPNNDGVITTGINFENVRIWSFEELRQLFEKSNQDGYIVIPPPGLHQTIETIIYDIVIDSDHNLLIGIAQNAIQLRDLDTYDLVKSLTVSTDYSDQIQISQDEQTLVFNHHGELFIWDLDDVLTSDNPIMSSIAVEAGSTFALSPDGNSIAVSHSETLEIQSLSQDEPVSVDLFQLCPVIPINRINVEIIDSELIVTGCDDPLRWQLQIPGSSTINAYFHGNSMRDVIYGDTDYLVQVRNRENESVSINPPDYLYTWFDSPILSRDNSWLVFGSPFSGLHFWNVETGDLVHSILASDTRNIFLSEDDKLLVTFGSEIGVYPVIRLWGVPSD